MADNDFDPRDILLEVTAEMQAIIREVMTDLTAPQMQSKLLETWTTAPDELKEQFAQARPEEYQALMQMMKKTQRKAGRYG